MDKRRLTRYNLAMNGKSAKFRILIWVVIITALVFLASCAESEIPRTPEAVSLIEESWLSDAGIGKDGFFGYDSLTPAQMTAVTKAAEKHGITLIFQNGALSLKDRNGREIKLGEWQNAAQSAALPRPEYGVLQYTVADGEYFSACYFEYDAMRFETYTATLKAAGYSLEIIEETVIGGSVYYAENISGYSVSAALFDKVLIIECDKVK